MLNWPVVYDDDDDFFSCTLSHCYMTHWNHSVTIVMISVMILENKS